MHLGIPDKTARKRTVTLYIDTSEFMEAADIAGKDEWHLLLVNRSGNILWHTTDRFNKTKGEAFLNGNWSKPVKEIKPSISADKKKVFRFFFQVARNEEGNCDHDY